LRHYEGRVRQIVVRENGHDKPAFLITNDSDSPLELLVANYARRWRVENGIAEAVKFFPLNALSSPILIKIYFDVLMTLMADTLYTMLARHLRGFEECDAPTLYRHLFKAREPLRSARVKCISFTLAKLITPFFAPYPGSNFPAHFLALTMPSWRSILNETRQRLCYI